MTEFEVIERADADAAVAEWEHFPASTILHHGKRCCAVAREWLFATDYSQLAGGDPLTGPRWIRHRYTWGPSRWPISWCEAVRQKTLDCGALAALASEVFAARGVRAYAAQFIQQFTADATLHWQKRWDEGGAGSVHWIKGDTIYHEGCAVLARAGEVKLWDASAGWWVEPRQAGGYGGLLAARVFAPESEAPPEGFLWGAHRLAPNRWQKIERVRRTPAERPGATEPAQLAAAQAADANPAFGD